MDSDANNPSPSGDPWFDKPENLKDVEEAIEQSKREELKTYTMDDIKSALGIS